MAVFTIDGTLEEAVVKRQYGLVTQYARLRFVGSDGREQVFGKTIAEKGFAQQLQPGTRGRFYMFKLLDHQGICGLRDSSGGAHFAFLKGGENGMLICACVGVAALFVSFLLRTWLTSWAVICIFLGVPGYIAYRTMRQEAERRFAADQGQSFS